jgi:hypothetical protein
MVSLSVLMAGGGAWSAGPADAPTQEVPPLAWVRRVKPSKAVCQKVMDLINERRGGVVAALGRPDLITKVNGFEQLWYRCAKGSFRFSFDQQPGGLRTQVGYDPRPSTFADARKAAAIKP